MIVNVYWRYEITEVLIDNECNYTYTQDKLYKFLIIPFIKVQDEKERERKKSAVAKSVIYITKKLLRNRYET